MNKIFTWKKKCFIGFLLLFLSGSYVIAQTGNGRKIIFITKTDLMDDNNPTIYVDSLFVRELLDEGYDVTTSYVEDASDATHYPVLDYGTLDTPNLVIVGYGCFSADFEEHFNEWAAVKAPVLFLSPYLVRCNHLRMIHSPTVTAYADASSPLMIKINDLNDQFAEDLTIDTSDGLVDFLTREIYDLCEFDAATLESTSSAKLLATVAASENGMGNVFACRWPADVETYSGGVTPQGIRSYFPMGYGHENYFAFTDNGLKMWLNEVAYLAQQYSPPTAIVPNAVNNISLYYNSIEDLVQIRNSAKVVNVEIFNITGNLLYSLPTYNQESLQINGNMLQNGIFIVKMQLNDNRTHSVFLLKY